MGQDGREVAISQANKTVRKLGRNTEITKFNQQIICLTDRVGMRLLEDALQILERKMKIAAQSQFQIQRRTNLLPQLIEQPGEVGAIIGVTIVGVRGGDRVSNAVRRGHAAHFDGYIPGFGAVVNLGQKVAVDVDHEEILTCNA